MGSGVFLCSYYTLKNLLQELFEIHEPHNDPKTHQYVSVGVITHPA